MIVDKAATKAARARHNAGVEALNEFFLYDPAKSLGSLQRRPGSAPAHVRARRRAVRAARRRNRR